MTIIIMLSFVILLALAVPIGIAVGITSMLPSLLTDSFTVSGVFILRSMVGGINQTTLLAIPLFVLSGIIMARAECPESFSMFLLILLARKQRAFPVPW